MATHWTYFLNFMTQLCVWVPPLRVSAIYNLWINYQEYYIKESISLAVVTNVTSLLLLTVPVKIKQDQKLFISRSKNLQSVLKQRSLVPNCRSEEFTDEYSVFC